MSNPITLWRKLPTVSSDEACTTITSYTLAPAPTPGPYQALEKETAEEKLVYVPSLRSLCIRRLVDFPEQLATQHPFRLTYQPPSAPGRHDILQEVIPIYKHAVQAGDRDFMKFVDPRLWAVLVQLYTNLPERFRTYIIPLSDTHLPLLQQIPSGPNFALLTIVHLRHCREIDDDTVVELRELHGLVALDLDTTAVSAWGINRLAKTLVRCAEQDGSVRLAGPWGLRLLCLRDCKKVNNDVYNNLKYFPLLTIIDLRGTRCTPASYTMSPFKPHTNELFFSPTPAIDTLTALDAMLSNTKRSSDTRMHKLYPHPDPHYLYIHRLQHAPPARRGPSRRPVASSEGYTFPKPRQHRAVFVPPDIKPAITSGPSLTSAEVALQNAVAEVEGEATAKSAAALNFYSTYRAVDDSNPNGVPVLESLPRDRRCVQGLALYRPPRPYSILEDLRTRGGAKDGIQIPTRVIPSKRPRIDADDAPMAAEDARRRGESAKAIKAVWGMVGRRKSSGDVEEKPGKGRAVRVSDNPFLRQMAKSAFETPERTESQGVDAPARRSKASGAEHTASDDEDHETCEKSIFELPPPTTKPLKPISSLPKPPPPPPPQLSKSTPAHKSSSKLAVSKSANRTVQMKLSVFAEQSAMTRSASTTSLNSKKNRNKKADSALASASSYSTPLAPPISRIQSPSERLPRSTSSERIVVPKAEGKERRRAARRHGDSAEDAESRGERDSSRTRTEEPEDGRVVHRKRKTSGLALGAKDSDTVDTGTASRGNGGGNFNWSAWSSGNGG